MNNFFLFWIRVHSINLRNFILRLKSYMLFFLELYFNFLEIVVLDSGPNKNPQNTLLEKALSHFVLCIL